MGDILLHTPLHFFYSARVMLTFPKQWTIFDVETTGLSPTSGDRIIEIAGVHIKDGTILQQSSFASLVNPHREISWEAASINGITNEEVAKAQSIEQILPQFLSFAEGSLLVAHNASFDLSFLDVEKEMCWGYIDIPECFCTMQLSRKLFPHEFRHNLDVVAKRLGFDNGSIVRHRALPDVLLTAKVFLALLQQGKFTSLEELRAAAGMKVVA